MLVTLSKGHIWEPPTLRQHLALLSVRTSSAVGDICFIRHVTLQNHSIEGSCIFTGESYSQQVSILKILVGIDILIVKRKYASSKVRILQI